MRAEANTAISFPPSASASQRQSVTLLRFLYVPGVLLITHVSPGGATDEDDRITAVNLTREVDADHLPPVRARVSRYHIAAVVRRDAIAR